MSVMQNMAKSATRILIVDDHPWSFGMPGAVRRRFFVKIDEAGDANPLIALPDEEAGYHGHRYQPPMFRALVDARIRKEDPDAKSSCSA